MAVEREMTNREELMHLLNSFIARSIEEAAGERDSPRYDTDRSHAYITERQEKIKELRSMREQLERLMYGDAGI